MKKLNFNLLFSKQPDKDIYYRIPALLTTSKGTLIAVIDSRKESSLDNPNKIDKVIKRSTDNGETWSEEIFVCGYPGMGRQEGAAAIDPVIVEDKKDGTLWIMYCHSPGSIGIMNSRAGIAVDENGNRILYNKKNEPLYIKDNKLYDKHNQLTEFTVDDEGNVYKNGEKICNYYLGGGEILEGRTCFLEAVYSKDDGLTWSNPIQLNHQVKEDWMCFIGPGPGIGIQLENGEHKGRLVVPIYYSNQTNVSWWHLSCCVIYSDNCGKTWHRGKSPNDGRVFNGNLISSQELTQYHAQITESQVVELNDGKLMLFMRNHDVQKRIAVCYSDDGGVSWGEITYVDELVNPICQTSVIKIPDQNKDCLLFCGPNSETERINGTLRYSDDGGKTWKKSKQLWDKEFVYNCLTITSDNQIGILFEGDLNGETVYFTKFPLSFVSGEE